MTLKQFLDEVPWKEMRPMLRFAASEGRPLPIRHRRSNLCPIVAIGVGKGIMRETDNPRSADFGIVARHLKLRSGVRDAITRAADGDIKRPSVARLRAEMEARMKAAQA